MSPSVTYSSFCIGLSASENFISGQELVQLRCLFSVCFAYLCWPSCSCNHCLRILFCNVVAVERTNAKHSCDLLMILALCPDPSLTTRLRLSQFRHWSSGRLWVCIFAPSLVKATASSDGFILEVMSRLVCSIPCTSDSDLQSIAKKDSGK